VRVHAAAQGWPIVGDNIYGNGPRFGDRRCICIPAKSGFRFQEQDPVRAIAPAPEHMQARLRDVWMERE